MKYNQERMDIRLFKYESYVKRHPMKPYGYYCLGKLHIMLADYGKAEDYFNRALILDPEYAYAKIGMIESFLHRKKLIKAVRYFSKNNVALQKKYIYQVRLVRSVTSIYGGNYFNSRLYAVVSRLLLKYEFQTLSTFFNRNMDNIIVRLTLCIYYLQKDSSAYGTMALYRSCLNLDGLDDNMRWALVKALSKDNPSILRDLSVAARFATVPDEKISCEYVNTIFTAVLVCGNIKKAAHMLKNANDNHQHIAEVNLWKYLYLCRENSHYDSSVSLCCKKLLKSGWMDRVLAETINKLMIMKIAEPTELENRLLDLFGYAGDTSQQISS